MRKKRVFVPAILATILLWLSGSTSFGDAIFEDVEGSAEVLSPPNGAIFYVQNAGDYVTVTATGKSKISYKVTTDSNWLSVEHTYRITTSQGRIEGDQICLYPGDTTKFESVAIGPDVLTVTQDYGVGRYWVSVYHKAVNLTTDQIIGIVSSNVDEFEVKVIPATASGFQGLGTLPGDYYISFACDVSGDGSTVVGWCSTPFVPVVGEYREQAFRWTQDGGMVGLGDLPTGGFRSQAYGVSADGSVVVGSGTTSAGIARPEQSEAFRWTQDGGMVGLGYLPGGAPPVGASLAYGVSADGSVVVGYSSSALGGEAFRWTQGGGMIGLGGLPGGFVGSVAKGVSADGSVVVGFGNTVVYDPYPYDVNTNQAFRWENGTMTGLDFLPGYRLESVASAVSADGSVVVGVSGSVQIYCALCGMFRWENGTMTDLGHFGPYDMSADGSVIVGRGQGKAAIWDAYHGVRKLQDVLVNNYLMDLKGFEGFPGLLWRATGISDDGCTIVGTGLNANGDTEAWIARLDMGMITAVRGNVTLDSFKAKLFDRIRRLSVLETGGDGYVRVRHPSESEIDIGPNSKMRPDGSLTKTKLELFKGKIFARVKNLPPGALEIRTPQAVAGCRGTELVVETTVDESQIIVLEGEADVSTPNGSQTITLGQNQGIIVTAAGLGAPFPVDPDQIDRWWERAVDIGDFCGEGSDQPDGYVDYWDLLYFAQRWHTDPSDTNWDPRCDLAEEDNYVDYWDLLVFAQQWHKGEPP